MKVHVTINHDEKLKPVKAPGLAIFIRQTEARELMLQMRELDRLATGLMDNTPYAELHNALKEALED